MRVGYLIKHDQGPRRITMQHIAEVDILERIAFQHQTLMRGIVRYQSGKIGTLSPLHLEISR